MSSPQFPTTTRVRRRRARSLDRQLHRLGREEPRCRWEVGILAAAFLQTNSHQRLGFMRIGDYARERLGWSGRELQSVASTVATAAQLPIAQSAFGAGEISWSHLRLLAIVATPQTEAHWVALARRRTVRELATLIPPATANDRATDGGKIRAEAVATVLDESEGVERLDGESIGRFALRCPPAVRSEWKTVVELARRVAGEQLSTWQAAEFVAAEGLSAVAPHDVSITVPCTTGEKREGPVTWCDTLDPAAVVPHDASQTAASSARDHATSSALAHAVEPAELDRRLRATIRRMHRVNARLGRLLRRCAEREMFRELGYRSWSEYAGARCAVGLRKARMLVMLDRRCARVCALASAYRRGDISALRAITILPVADAGSAPAWIGRAKVVTLRRLVAEAEWALAQRNGRRECATPPAGASIDPPPLDADLQESPSRQMCALEEDARPSSAVTFAAPPSVVSLLWTAIGAFTSNAESRWVGLARLLTHVRLEWERSPRHRDPIFAREHWRCAVPGCSMRRNLNDHHIRFRSRAGNNDLTNRVAICAAHHLHGIHRGLIRATGTAPDAILWELGVGRDGTALLRLLGDRYLDDADAA